MNPYAIIAALIIWAASLAGVGYWQNGVGHVEESATWQKKDNAELKEANAKILQLETEARASEQAHSETQHLISTGLQKDLQNAEIQRQKDVADARSGAIRLRDPGAPAVQNCGGGTSETATGTSGRDGQAGAELSANAVEFLLTEADRADAVVRQLTACQAVVDADRAP
jgi:hypothetical protein